MCKYIYYPANGSVYALKERYITIRPNKRGIRQTNTIRGKYYIWKDCRFEGPYKLKMKKEFLIGKVQLDYFGDKPVVINDFRLMSIKGCWYKRSESDFVWKDRTDKFRWEYTKLTPKSKRVSIIRKFVEIHSTEVEGLSNLVNCITKLTEVLHPSGTWIKLSEMTEKKVFVKSTEVVWV